ncbi:hypothetical protein DSL72_008126 [Monilinia vaccinii-corymbosi]|uniref:Glycoside hydrolase family 2 protein n=1 Tax=Monilinia vaccinii-corymbosi TaxID=61207 RepID=A0A8A3PIT4_9HELO|nr:hypothetical protein DSL72_008126 [Monilinia vaccinii-corymbosi]
MDCVSIPSFIGKALQGRSQSKDRNISPKAPNPLSYPKSSLPYDPQLFENPSSEYRGCPFWAWNAKLNKDQLLRQIDYFAEMGMGGFHMHVRTGLDTEYMGSEFMDMVRACVDYAEKKNMLACLYDDDRWPSGAAGGKVIEKYPEHKGKHLLFTPHAYGTVPLEGGAPASARASRSENGHMIARYDIELDNHGTLKSSRILKEDECGENVWYAYVETNPNSSWFNDQTYIDTLSEDAMARFIEITHGVYKEKCGDNFGTVIPCIFTDEPQFATKTTLPHPRANEDIFLPWTTDLPESFKKEYNSDIVEFLPQVIWNLPNDNPSLSRYRYHDHVCERFVSAFIDQISRWCRRNDLYLDGHMMEEPTLYSQTTALGEAMRCYRNMDMPGIDLLVDGVEFNTAKQASSVSRQMGRRGTMCEIYGVTHWYFTFEGHKGCGDWQAALGITFRVHHLAWFSMVGEGKRDYPASINYQSPWYKEYGYVEDHFARVGVAMTRGKAVTRVGVIHPIESYWLCFGPDQSGDEAGSRDRAFSDLTNWLLHGLIDFDFISESSLPNQVGKSQKGKKLTVGFCEYEVIIVPNLRTIRSSTLKILQEFSKAGGHAIIAGSSPDLIDAMVPSQKPTIQPSTNVFWSQQTILCALNEYCDLRVTGETGSSAEKLLYQMREDGDERFVFICNMNRTSPVQAKIELKDHWDISKMDTFTGQESILPSRLESGWTQFDYKFEGCASLLMRLRPRIRHSITDNPRLIKVSEKKPLLDSKVTLAGVKLSELNVLMLDYASYKLDSDEHWSDFIEVLKIDNIIRDRLKLPRKGSAFRQPWSIPSSERAPRTNVTMRFLIRSEFNVDVPLKLALEDAEKMQITINCTELDSKGADGWWVDEDIKTLKIPANVITEGTNTLTISFPFGILTNIERLYLLGAFSVGAKHGKYQLEKPKSIFWGDVTKQGLPFYAGNLTYICDISLPPTLPDTTVHLSVPEFSSPVLAVALADDEQKLGRIAFQPRTLDITSLGPGDHKIAITAFGNRYNSFGHVHLPDGITDGCSPDIWRTGGSWWTDRYNVKPIGILECPSLKMEVTSVDVERGGNEEAWEVIE